MNTATPAVAHTIEIDGVRWAYTQRGEGPLVLFLHSLLSTSTMFEPLISTLADRYRCVAVDWPGHGCSGFDPAGWLCEDLERGIARLADHLQTSTISLVGLSQGAAVSLRVALRHPDRVAALAFMGAVAGDPPPLLVQELTELGTLLASISLDERRNVLGGLQPRFHGAGWVDAHPEAARRELDEMLSHDPRAVALATRVPASFLSVEDLLPTLRCPTLILCGSEDAHASSAPAMADLIPDACVVTVPGAGHHVTQDAPDACNREVGAFLDRAHGLASPTAHCQARNT